MTQATASDTPTRADFERFICHLSPNTQFAVMEVAGELRSVAHHFNQRGEDSLAQSGLSYSQYRILMQLLFNEYIYGQSALNPSEISERHGVSRNTISSLIRSLEKAELVERELDQQDRRKFKIHLTAAGRDLVYAHAREHFQAIDAIFSVLNADEVQLLGRILQKLNKQISL